MDAIVPGGAHLLHKDASCLIAHDAPLWDLFDEKLAYTGYSYEKHNTVSKDKYHLTLVRLVKEGETDADRAKRAPVLFQHGLTMTAENWFTLDDKNERPIPLQAMDAGYDVWLTNNRGTRYSIDHDTLDAGENGKYWDFDWEQQGQYDGPANIDKVLAVTGYDKLAYVGFSLGTM